MAELDWDDLRYFLRAVQAKTLAGAARAMGVEHTTVGRRLAALERALGVSLVVRGPSGLAPTVVGQQVFEAVERLARSIEALQGEVAGRTSVRVVVPSGFAMLFVDAVASLRGREPPISIELISGSRQVDLVHGEADVAVRVGPIAHEELVARRAGKVGSALYASTAYLAGSRDVDVADLRGHAVIGFDPALAGMPAARWLAERTQAADIVLRGREMTDVLAAALAGLGLAVLPCHLGDAEPTLVRLTEAAVATRELSIVYRRESSRVPHVRAVIDAIAECLHAQGDRLGGTKPQ